jgi:hypothetical protein
MDDPRGYIAGGTQKRIQHFFLCTPDTKKTGYALKIWNKMIVTHSLI